MPLSLWEKVSLNFGSGVMAVALIGILSYAGMAKLASDTYGVAQAHAVLERIEVLRQQLSDAEVEQQRFLLTGYESARQPLSTLGSDTRRALDQLRRLKVADGLPTVPIDSIVPLAAAAVADLERIDAIGRSHGRDSAIAALVATPNPRPTDRVRRELAELTEEERFILGQRTRAQAASTSGAAVLLAVGMLISFVAAALALRNIRRYLAERRILEVERALVLERERTARAAAEDANRAKADFLRMISHELRTPLTAIQGYLELLDLGIYGAVSGEQRPVLARIEQNQRHLLGIINELLEFARLDARHVKLLLTSVPLESVRTAVEPSCRPQLDAKRLRYSWRWENGEDAILVRADSEKTRQIILNLISNASKFTPLDGEIEVECATLADVVHIRVRDTGPGIPAHKLAAIFEPFVQLERDADRPHEGTGLGLSISRELARAMGGDLTVESTVGQGSTFILSLPRGSADLPAQETTVALWREEER